MKMSYEEFDLANEKFVEDPDNNPLLIPCATEGCDEEVLEYDSFNEVYFCPVCGRKVKKKNILKYLKKVANGEYS